VDLASRFGPRSSRYKPEFWDKVQELDQWTNKYDPIMTCQPMGIPREGTPRRIFQTANDITMLYTNERLRRRNREFRVIPTDDRKHNPQKAIEATYMGYTVGAGRATRCARLHLVCRYHMVGRGGLFHSENMHIVEKFTRKAMKSFTKSPSKTPDVSWNRG